MSESSRVTHSPWLTVVQASGFRNSDSLSLVVVLRELKLCYTAGYCPLDNYKWADWAWARTVCDVCVGEWHGSGFSTPVPSHSHRNTPIPSQLRDGSKQNSCPIPEKRLQSHDLTVLSFFIHIRTAYFYLKTEVLILRFPSLLLSLTFFFPVYSQSPDE